MSELAKFVAATLRDKVVVDMMEEVEKERVNARRVAVTGLNRSVVYSTAQFDDNGRRSSWRGSWRVHMGQVSSCPISDLDKVEIWFGNTLHTRFDDKNTLVQFVTSNSNSRRADHRFVPTGSRSSKTSSDKIIAYAHIFFSNEVVYWISARVVSACGESEEVSLPQQLLQGDSQFKIKDLMSLPSLAEKTICFSDIGFAIDRNYRGLQAHYETLPESIRTREHRIVEEIRRRCMAASSSKNDGSSSWNNETSEWEFFNVIHLFLRVVEADEKGDRFDIIMSSLEGTMKHLWEQPNFGTQASIYLKGILDQATKEIKNNASGGGDGPAKIAIEQLQEVLTRLCHVAFPNGTAAPATPRAPTTPTAM